MQEGTAIHKKIQKEGGASYRPEVSMKMDFQMDENLTITLEAGLTVSLRICIFGGRGGQRIFLHD